MKKQILALASFIAMGCAVSSAQNYLVNNPDNKAYFGARVGIDVSSTGNSKTDIYGNGAGFTAGAIYNIPICANFYFEPGLGVFYDTFDDNLIINDDGRFDKLDGSLRNFGFRVPFSFGYRFDFTDDMSVYLYTGPVLNLNVTARECFHDLPSSDVMDHGFKRFDLQYAFGAGFSWGQYYVSATGAAGCTKVYKGHDDSFRRNTFNISVGYNF